MTQTILYGVHETELTGATTDPDRLWIPLDELERTTGWTPKREGMCRGEVCIPVPVSRRADWLSEGRLIDFAAFAGYLGHAVVRDADRGVWAFGPIADRGVAGGTGPVVAPDFRLPDLDGNMHALSDHRGKKVLLYCWSSW